MVPWSTTRFFIKVNTIVLRPLLTYTLYISASLFLGHTVAYAQERGEVVKYIGVHGELIMSRDGVVLWLTEGTALKKGDILRSKQDGVATINFDGCEYKLPAGEDIILDDNFCQPRSMAEFAVNEESAAQSSASRLTEGSNVNQMATSPLVVGGVVLSAGGLAAASGGDGGGAGSQTSNAAGVPRSNPSSS